VEKIHTYTIVVGPWLGEGEREGERGGEGLEMDEHHAGWNESLPDMIDCPQQD